MTDHLADAHAEIDAEASDRPTLAEAERGTVRGRRVPRRECPLTAADFQPANDSGKDDRPF